MPAIPAYFATNADVVLYGSNVNLGDMITGPNVINGTTGAQQIYYNTWPSAISTTQHTDGTYWPQSKVTPRKIHVLPAQDGKTSYQLLYMDLGQWTGQSNNVVTITNLAGQVRIDDTSDFRRGSYFRVTGAYDPVAGLGNINFRGHQDGYAFTQGKYGFLWDNKWLGVNRTGIAFDGNTSKTGGGCHHFQLDNVEVCGGFFAGIKANQNRDSTGAYTDYDGVTIIDNYFHEILSEGVYFGSASDTEPQAKLRNFVIRNNRFIRCGTDPIQVSKVDGVCDIDHNFCWGACDWKAAFQPNQDNALQPSVVNGGLNAHHNIFLGAGQNWLNFAGRTLAGTTLNGLPINIERNLMHTNRGPYAGYLGQAGQTMAGQVINLRYNLMLQQVFTYDEIWTTADVNKGSNKNYVFKNALNGAVINLTGNKTDSTGGKTVWYLENGQGVTLNNGQVSGDFGALTETGLQVRNLFGTGAGLGDNFDYKLFEFWCATVGPFGSGSKQGQAVSYNIGDYVGHKSQFYKAKAVNSSVEPGVTANWQASWARVWWQYDGTMVLDPADTTGLSVYPPDDVSLKPTSVYAAEGYGVPPIQPSGSVPLTPSNLTAVAQGSASIKITWTDNATNETGYRLERSTDQSTWTQSGSDLAAGTTTRTVTGLSANTRYYWRVMALGSSGNSPYSNVDSAVTSDTAPAAPSGLTATAYGATYDGNGNEITQAYIALSFTDNATNETGFDIEQSTDGVTFALITSLAANTVAYNVTGLGPSATRYYRVRSKNAIGASAYSNVASATTPAAPTQPTEPDTDSEIGKDIGQLYKSKAEVDFVNTVAEAQARVVTKPTIIYVSNDEVFGGFQMYLRTATSLDHIPFSNSTND